MGNILAIQLSILTKHTLVDLEFKWRTKHHADEEWRNGMENNAEMPVVLFVDDDPHFISAMQRSFRPYRVQLEVAFHGMQGLVSAVEVRPDVVVTDLRMPFATGDDLMAYLSRHPSTTGVPIVVLSGKPGVMLTSRYRRLGVRSVIAKPVHFEEVLNELASLIAITPR